MSLLSIGINVVLATLLFLLNGCLGKWKMNFHSFIEYSELNLGKISEKSFSENFFQMIVYPSVYLALVCWGLQCLGLSHLIRKLWLLIPSYWAIRMLHSLWRDEFVFVNWYPQIYAFILSTLLGEGTLYCLVIPLINDEQSVFIPVDEFRNAFWYAALAFMAKLLWDSVKGHLVGENLFPSTKKSDVIIRRYNRYKNKYGSHIQYILNKKGYMFKSAKQRDHFLCLLYAIMIYEAHNRPIWIRIIEYGLKLVCPFRKMSLGIMQIQTNNWISDSESIFLAIDKVYAVFSVMEISDKVDRSIYDYNPSDNYHEQVLAIYHEITQYLNLSSLGRHRVKVSKVSKQACIKGGLNDEQLDKYCG